MTTSVPTKASITGAAVTEAGLKTSLDQLIDFLNETAGVNFALSFSNNGTALTVALKNLNGVDPTATNPVKVKFRNATPATGDFTELLVTAALSLTISSGSTLGAVSATAFRLWIVAFNDANTVRLGVINCLNSGLNIYPLSGWGVASSTAEGGAGAADSAHVFYTGTAVSSKAYTVLGYGSFESGITTAGTWNANPTRAQILEPGIALPGQVVAVARTSTGAQATGTTVIPDDDTIPQNTEGDQYLSASFAPISAANRLAVTAQVIVSSSVAGGISMAAALFQNAGANAISAVTEVASAANFEVSLAINHAMLAGTTTSFAVRAGGGSAGTTTLNGNGGSRQLGGVMNTFLEVQEMQA
jgi:hypothetical protein